MSEIHLRRIQTVLRREYDGLIDLSDVEGRPEREIEANFLTRSQAALAVFYASGVDRMAAAKSVTDGFNDNGIDAIYFDEEIGTAYIVQSKWVSGGMASPDLGSIDKFVSGFKDLLAARFDRFNQKVVEKRAAIERALESPNVEFLLVVAYTGTQPLSQHAEMRLNDLLGVVNDPTDVVSYRVYSQKELYNAISGGLERSSIKLEDVTLYDWGWIREPYDAVYGQVAAQEVASWYNEYGVRLLARNIRQFKGDTEVNQSIKRTLTSEPGKFWYFNNGITALCEKIGKAPKGAPNRDAGQFVFEGVSVVNGAQTVGVVASSVSQGFQRAKEARVLVRFISLEDCPEGFATEVTTATNTQNRIERRDFASLDPNHERLRKELALDLDRTYVFKSGDRVPPGKEGCDIEEATVALACAYPDVQLAADAKRNISRLWVDIDKEPYTLIFNEALTALRLWRSVEISRAVRSRIEEEKASCEGRARLVAIHGRRFILHRVFQSLPLGEFDEVDLDMSPILLQAREQAVIELEQITEAIGEHFPDSYLNNFFKSGSKCQKLNKLLPDIEARPTAYYSKASPVQTPLFEMEE
jgi:hypothetical protein